MAPTADLWITAPRVRILGSSTPRVVDGCRNGICHLVGQYLRFTLPCGPGVEPLDAASESRSRFRQEYRVPSAGDPSKGNATKACAIKFLVARSGGGRPAVAYGPPDVICLLSLRRFLLPLWQRVVQTM